QLFKVTGVFNGTPTLAATWSVAAANIKMTSPVLDFDSGNILIGASDGILYAIKSSDGTQAATPLPIGSGGTNGGGIVDSPILDGSNGTVFASAAANVLNPAGVTQ